MTMPKRLRYPFINMKSGSSTVFTSEPHNVGVLLMRLATAKAYFAKVHGIVFTYEVIPGTSSIKCDVLHNPKYVVPSLPKSVQTKEADTVREKKPTNTSKPKETRTEQDARIFFRTAFASGLACNAPLEAFENAKTAEKLYRSYIEQRGQNGAPD